MPSSNDSTNPNSPFGVEYGYPQGTRITDPAVVASLQTGNPLPNPLGSSKASLFSASSLPRMQPTKAHQKADDVISAMASDDTALITARHMANPEVSERYFHQKNDADLKALDTAYKAHNDPQRALDKTFSRQKLGNAPTVSSMEKARDEIHNARVVQTSNIFKQSNSILAEAGVDRVETTTLNKNQHMAGRIIAGQVERNVSQPMPFKDAYNLANRHLGDEGKESINMVGNQRLDAYSDLEKSAFKKATKDVTGGEPKVEQSFADLTTVVKELSNALKELKKSASPQKTQESKAGLIQQRHDLAMERQTKRGDLTEARDMFLEGNKEALLNKKHQQNLERQDMGASQKLGAMKEQHKFNLELEEVRQENREKLEERREKFREEQKGKKAGFFKNMFLGAMHRGDVTSKANLTGRGLRRGFTGAMGIAGAGSIEASLGAFAPLGIPIGQLASAPMGMLKGIAGKASQVELLSVQAEILRTGTLVNGPMIGTKGAMSNTVSEIFALSSELGISPSQSASMLKDVGFADPSTDLSVGAIGDLTAQGFNPAQVAQIGGQLGMLNAGLGSKDVLGLMRASGMRGSQAMDFTSRISDFTRGRRVAGLGLEKNFLGKTAGRVQSMGVGAEAGLATLGKVQGTVLQAGQGLTSMFGGMTDIAIQASAFEQAGGDLFKAQGIAEKISGSPKRLMSTLRSQGMSEGQINLALAGKKFTTGQVEQIRRASGGTGELDTRTVGLAGDTPRLAVSQSLAKRAQADVKQMYSTANDGESFIEKLDAMLKADTKYQKEVLDNMVSSAQIKSLGDKVTTLTTTVQTSTGTVLTALDNGLNAVNGLLTYLRGF